ncbi:CBS domain-containing protein [Hyunsoonleella rubra]|uniref:CBS domain-containing protein n=1 Tax=Hyunsoonleella rubra TaxID=1737062 RepID=A0ABW5TAI5_9FLAO
MGDLNVSKLHRKKDRANYVHHLLNDIEALERLLEKGWIESEPIRIGAEQEFCLVKHNFSPSSNALDILHDIDDPHFATEIGDYNLEANLDPLELKGSCFSEMHRQLKSLLKKAEEAAAKKDTKIVLAGILPSIGLDNVGEKQMTPLQRYTILNEVIKASRKQDFNIHIQGVDELNLLFDSVMLEGCNTSFQVHLQVAPDNFIDAYNWAQAIAGPVLSTCSNSPLLFGKELWSETRIALFTQSIDTRANSYQLNENQSRVSFGRGWYTGSVTDIFKDNISRFRSFLTSDFIHDSVSLIEEGKVPRLLALQLHNGTVYPWNRACYGVGNGKPHLRIENRYIPSGPTVVDEMANMVFWVGVMMGKHKKYNNIHETWDFKDVKTNFFNAARYGMAAQIYWDGKYVSCKDLILDELLPMAYKGLYRFGVDPKDAEYYLAVIENRVKGLNGSEWTVRSYRHLLKSHRRFEAMQILTSKLYEKQIKDYPVSTWRILQETSELPEPENRVVKHIMSTDVYSVDKNDSVELVLNIMQWKNIHHLPVINHAKELLGVLSWTDVKDYLDDKEKKQQSVESIMEKDIVVISERDSIEKAKGMMARHNIHLLPVTKNGKLIGLITSNDF